MITSLFPKCHRTFFQVGIRQGTSQFLDDLNGLQISGPFESPDRLNCQTCEEVLVLSEYLGAERGFGYVHQVLWRGGGERRGREERERGEGEYNEQFINQQFDCVTTAA